MQKMELKEVRRMFAIMVFEMRAYFCHREEHPEYCVHLLSPTNHVTLSLNC
jgi:hypothetical protein